MMQFYDPVEKMRQRRLAVKMPNREKRATLGTRTNVLVHFGQLLIVLVMTSWILHYRVLWRTSISTPSDRGVAGDQGHVVVPLMNTTNVSISVSVERIIDVLMPPDIDSLRSLLSSDASFRFPSVEERVRYYMGGWYDFQPHDISPHCPSMKYLNYPNKSNYCFIKSGRLFSKHYIVEKGHLGRPEGVACTAHVYLRDVYEYLLPAVQDGGNLDGGTKTQRFLVRFGDLREQFPFPVFVKTRLARRMERGDPKFDPILAPLEMTRHFHDPLNHLKNDGPDRPWENKTATLVWRGVSTGERLDILDEFEDKFGLKGEKNTSLPNSIDIGFNYLVYLDSDEEEDYEHLIADAMSIESHLSHKYLLNLEGNDVSTALKWMLYSNSVVFMPIPTCVSWAMEEFLVPWYHYVPLQDDIMDLFEKMQWCMAHDAECKQISLHATQYMNDLWMSEQATINNKRVLQEIMSKYDSYGKMLETCINHD